MHNVLHNSSRPLDLGDSTVAIIGKPTIDGDEACGNTIVPISSRCTDLLVSETKARTMSGRDEAEVVHGVCSELALQGLTVTPSALAKSKR